MTQWIGIVSIVVSIIGIYYKRRDKKGFQSTACYASSICLYSTG